MVTRTVEGEPIRVGESELVPVVRVTTGGQRKAYVGSHQVTGGGWGFVRLRPIAILERSAAGERYIPVRDRTAQMLSGLLLAALLIPVLVALAVRLARMGQE